jgi:chromosomal replication initiator protein
MILEQLPKTELVNYMTIPGLKLGKNLSNQQVIDCVIDTVCTYFQVPKKLVLSKTRRKNVVRARHLCRWYIIKNTHMTLKEVGEIWGGADHTTIIHSRNVVKEQVEAKHPNEFKIYVQYLDKQL